MEIEPMTTETLKMLLRNVTSVAAMVGGLNEVDISKGAGVLGPLEKCLWTADGHRVSIKMDATGGFTIAKGKEPDPECPAGEA